jgi:hypothetical protein
MQNETAHIHYTRERELYVYIRRIYQIALALNILVNGKSKSTIFQLSPGGFFWQTILHQKADASVPLRNS